MAMNMCKDDERSIFDDIVLFGGHALMLATLLGVSIYYYAKSNSYLAEKGDCLECTDDEHEHEHDFRTSKDHRNNRGLEEEVAKATLSSTVDDPVTDPVTDPVAEQGLFSSAKNFASGMAYFLLRGAS